RMAFTAWSATAGLKLMKNFPHSWISAVEMNNLRNRISRWDTSFAGHHPCNRRSSSSPDEVPAHTPANARLWLPEPPGLRLPFCNARWHHRRSAQTDTVDTASPSTGQKHNAETDWLTEG